MKKLKTKTIILGITGSLLILIIAQLISQLLAGLLVKIHIPAFICNIIAGILYFILAYGILKIFAGKILKCKMEELGIPTFRIQIKWLAAAIALPLFVTAAYLLLPGNMERTAMTVSGATETICAGIFFTGLGAALVEEMVFRGFIMHLVLNKWGKKSAVIIPSMLFGILHIAGMDFSMLSCLQVLIAGTFVGIMFSLITLEFDSIWNSAVVHCLWNIVIIGGILTIGETADKFSLYTYVLENKSFAITGGEFGIEASIIAIAGYVLAGLFAYKGIKMNMHTNMHTG